MSIETQGLAIADAQMVAKMAKGNPMMRELKPRKSAFDSDDQMFLTVMGAMAETRMALELKREQMFEQTADWANEERNGYDEVIIGGGPTAAAYAAARVKRGYPRPLVITDMLGGKSFRMVPWYRLNSSNRPGELGLSSEQSALNVIPGAPVQNSMLNMDRFQDNSVQAYSTRTALLRYADLRKGTVEIVQLADSGVRKFIVTLEGDGVVYADRVLDARGLGEPVQLDASSTFATDAKVQWSERVLSVFDFAERFTGSFPFRDWHRVAVIGGGDSGKVVVEALLGTGPNRHMSVPMLDWIEQIDWYGRGLPEDCQDWRENQRSRYQDLGSFLRRSDEGRARLRVFNANAISADEGLDKVYVGGRPYDAVIVCIGFEPYRQRGAFQFDSGMIYANDGRTALARQAVGKELYTIGVAARLPFDLGDPDSTKRLPNNQVALFRNLPRVVQLAMKLGTIQPELEVTSAKVLRTTRKLVGKGYLGVPIRLGDEVRLLDQFGGEYARGTAVKPRGRYPKEGVVFVIEQDKYSYNGYENIEVTEDRLESIVIVPKLPQPQRSTPRRATLGYDINQEPLREGDRVRFTDYNSETQSGEVVGYDNEDYEYNLAVIRDGFARPYELEQDEYDSLVKEF